MIGEAFNAALAESSGEAPHRAPSNVSDTSAIATPAVLKEAASILVSKWPHKYSNNIITCMYINMLAYMTSVIFVPAVLNV